MVVTEPDLTYISRSLPNGEHIEDIPERSVVKQIRRRGNYTSVPEVLHTCDVPWCSVKKLLALARWLTWSSVLYTKRLWVQFLVVSQAWVASSVPSQGSYRRQPTNVFLTLMFLFVSLFLKSVNISSSDKGFFKTFWSVYGRKLTEAFHHNP